MEKIKEMDRGFEILINMVVGQYGYEWDAERDACTRRYRNGVVWVTWDDIGNGSLVCIGVNMNNGSSFVKDYQYYVGMGIEDVEDLYGRIIGIVWEMENGKVEIGVLERCTGILCREKAIKDKGKE